MQLFFYHLELCAPLFSLVFIGWGLAQIHFIPEAAQKALGSVTFKLLMPALLFKMLSHLSEMPPADWRVLIPFFGSCLFLFFFARGVYARLFRCGAAGTTVLAMAGIFGNNVQLGVPIVEVSLGPAAMSTISLLIVFNVLLLWTLAIASVEFGRADGKPDLERILKSLFKVVKNPVVLGILCGTVWGLTGWQLPKVVDQTVGLVAASTTPMCLLAVGMGLARHSFFASLPKGSVVTFVKIAVQPFFVWVLFVASRRDQRLSHGERIRGGGGCGEQRDLPLDASFRRGRAACSHASRRGADRLTAKAFRQKSRRGRPEAAPFISFPMGNQNPRDLLSRSA